MCTAYPVQYNQIRFLLYNTDRIVGINERAVLIRLYRILECQLGLAHTHSYEPSENDRQTDFRNKIFSNFHLLVTLTLV